MRLRFYAKCLLVASLTLIAMSIDAGGFQLWEQDAAGIGDLHAGEGAQANRAGNEYYNPASMVNLPSLEISGGLAYIPLKITYSGTVGTSPLAIKASSNTHNFIPNFHLVYPFLQRYAFGFGATVPFGLKTEYPLNNPIAGAATTTDLKTVNLNPSFAMRISNYLALGAGVDVLYGQATYDSAITFMIPAPTIHNTLSAWGYGWNAGVLFFVNPGVRLSLSYRSKITLDGKGTSESARVRNNDLHAQFNFPATTMFGLYAEINRKLAILFSADYTQWSVFDNLILHNVVVNGQPEVIGIHENYRNTWNFAAGLHYRLFRDLMLKVGFGHDQTPTQDGMRDVRLPDASRYGVSMGLQWRASRSITLDAGWIHFFVPDASVNNGNSVIHYDPISRFIAFITRTIGSSRTHVNVVGVQLNWRQS